MTLQELFGAPYNAATTNLWPNLHQISGIQSVLSATGSKANNGASDALQNGPCIYRDEVDRICQTVDSNGVVAFYTYKDSRHADFIIEMEHGQHGKIIWNDSSQTYDRLIGNGLVLDPLWSSIQLDQTNGALTTFNLEINQVVTNRLDGSSFSWTDKQLPGKQLFLMDSCSSIGIGFNLAIYPDGAFTLTITLPDGLTDYIHVEGSGNILSERRDSALHDGMLYFSTSDEYRITFDTSKNSLTVITDNTAVEIDQYGQICNTVTVK